MSLPARTGDPDVADQWRWLTSLPMASQTRDSEEVLTPGIRLRVHAEQVRHEADAVTADHEPR